MALTTLLIATLLAAQSPAKLAHTYAKDTKATYSIEVKVPDGDGVITSDVTFTSLDAEGNHKVSAPKVSVSMGGSEQTAELNIEKIKFDANGLVEQLEFSETGVALILPTVLSYLPNSSVEKNKSFEVKEKRESYTLEGSGKVIEYKEKEGKSQVVIEYKISLTPGGAEPGQLTFKSTFDVATGQLLLSEGTVEIGSQSPAPFTVKKKN